MGDGEKTDLTETALKRAFQGRGAPDIPDGWQAGVMEALKHQCLIDSVKERTGNMLLRFSCAAAGIAAALVLYFSLFFEPPPNESPLDVALSCLYSDTEVSELYSVIFQQQTHR
ncbi:MAG: hypothetical protein JW808_10180 [Victivallales bacterium]|nr:hypothetical protein [Victivallales bacterium]